MPANAPLPLEDENTFHVAVISDIHGYHTKDPDQAPSYCDIGSTDPTQNPLYGLKDLIQKERLQANLLLCPGDLAHHAEPVATQAVWKELNEIRGCLGASLLAATSGNHDVDSRYTHNKYDAKGMLQTLDPPYPLNGNAENDRYWARHFVFVEHPPYRLLILNSSAFHGQGPTDPHSNPEYEHGRVSPYTLNAIKSELNGREPSPVNILMCHHHPHPHSELRLGAGDLMKGGQELLEIIGSGEYGDWLVLHGHKHHPKIEYAAGSASSAVVFAAGSLAHVLYSDLRSRCANQFYILSFPYHLYDAHGFVGIFRSWDFLVEQGWQRALAGHQLPARGGFGWRGHMLDLVRRVVDEVKGTYKHWEELEAAIPELQFLLPRDLQRLISSLQKEPDIVVGAADSLPPVLIGRKA